MESRIVVATLLIIDGDVSFYTKVKDSFADQLIEVLSASSALEARSICSKRKPDVVLLDQLLSNENGRSLFAEIFQYNSQAKIISTSTQPNFDSAVKAFRSGAYDYLVKTSESDEVRRTILKAFDALAMEKRKLIPNDIEIELHDEETVLIGKDCLQETLMLVERAASVTSPVLITGETGTGKNRVAGVIHFKSPFRNAPFVSINCATLPENLMESELFGHEKGAFTGAFHSKRGILEMAAGSTLFLDEIGEIPLHLQAKLLSVLEEKKIRRIGSVTTTPVEFRIIASTSLPLENALGSSFRKDLYYRLNVIRIHLPPLRQRLEDIPELCIYLLKKIAPRSELSLPESEIEKLKDYDWPGNIRELKNLLERTFIIQKGPVLRPSEILVPQRAVNDSGILPRPRAADAKLVTLLEMEKAHIKCAFENRHSNCTQTARLLGISLSTLKRKLKEYGMR